MYEDKHLRKNSFLKRTLQLVLSISIFSCILCFSSGFSFFPHSFNVYFSTFLFSFLTHTLERKYMFLICNGILVFLAKTSVACSSSSSCVGYKEFSPASELYSEVKAVPVRDVGEEALVEASTESNSRENVALAAEEEQDQREEEKEKEKGYLLREEEEEREKEALRAEGEDEDEDGEEKSVIVEEEEENGEVLDATEGASTEDTQISTDELNKRIEDFIRKMKEEIRIEAQRQLITV